MLCEIGEGLIFVDYLQLTHTAVFGNDCHNITQIDYIIYVFIFKNNSAVTLVNKCSDTV